MVLTKELEERSKAEARAKKEEMIQSPSESFLYSLHTSGTSVADCQLCGRVYFAEHNAGYEEGELEKLKENAKKYPTKYIDVNDEFISIVSIGGK